MDNQFINLSQNFNDDIEKYQQFFISYEKKMTILRRILIYSIWFGIADITLPPIFFSDSPSIIFFILGLFFTAISFFVIYLIKKQQVIFETNKKSFKELIQNNI